MNRAFSISLLTFITTQSALSICLQKENEEAQTTLNFVQVASETNDNTAILGSRGCSPCALGCPTGLCENCPCPHLQDAGIV